MCHTVRFYGQAAWERTMGPVFFVMAILGCGDGNAACIQARTLTTHYASMAQCRAALPVQLAQNSDLSYPVIAADCRANGQQVVRAEATSNRG